MSEQNNFKFYLKHEIPLTLSSDAGSGVITYRSDDGSAFTTRIPVLQIPKEAKNLKIYMKKIRYWYTFQNITANKGNNHFYITNDISNATKYNITIPNGIYSVDSLNRTIQNELTNLGLPNNAVTLTGDVSSGQVFFQLITGYQIYFPSNTPYQLLGCTLNQKIPASALTTATYGEYAPNDATFSELSAVHLHCSLVSQSIVNGSYSDVIGTSIPDVSVGYQMIDQPLHLSKIPANNLLGAQVFSITSSITDQKNRPLDTDGEPWAYEMIVEYYLPA